MRRRHALLLYRVGLASWGVLFLACAVGSIWLLTQIGGVFDQIMRGFSVVFFGLAGIVMMRVALFGRTRTVKTSFIDFTRAVFSRGNLTALFLVLGCALIAGMLLWNSQT